MTVFDDILLKRYAQQLPGTYAPLSEETIPGTGRIGQEEDENYLPRHSAPGGISDKEDDDFDEDKEGGRSYDPLRTITEARKAFRLTPKQRAFNRKMKKMIGQPLHPMDLEPSPTVGDILQSRIHESFTRAADDFCSLGYMDTDLRIDLSRTIGDSLAVLNEFLADNGLMDMPVEPEVARKIVFKSAQYLVDDRYTITQIDPGQWEVVKYYEMDLSVPEEFYTVTSGQANDWRCNCPAWHRTHQPCKHVQMVKDFEAWGGNRRILEDLAENLGEFLAKRAGVDYIDVFRKLKAKAESMGINVQGQPSSVVGENTPAGFASHESGDYIFINMDLFKGGKRFDVLNLAHEIGHAIAGHRGGSAGQEYWDLEDAADKIALDMLGEHGITATMWEMRTMVAKRAQSTESDPYKLFDRKAPSRRPQDNRFIIYDIPQVQLEDQQPSARTWNQQLGWDVTMDDEDLALIRPGSKS